MPKNYLWIFKDSVRQDVDSFAAMSNVKKSDVYTNFNYNKGSYPIAVWELKGLDMPDLSHVTFNQNVILDKIHFWYYETLNSQSEQQTTIKFRDKFKSELNINLDDIQRLKGPLKG